MKLLSWNVNGLRAVHQKGFLNIFDSEQPDILCIQETKADETQLVKELKEIPGYKSYFCSAEKKGYSGVAIFSRREPKAISYGFGMDDFDSEGRILIADYNQFVLFNIYFPNGKASSERLNYKMAFYDAFLEHADRVKNQGRHVVICGDVNTAHKEIDLDRPKENSNVSGFLPQERAWIDKLIEHGYVDTFRIFNNASGEYTWWDYKTRARERNVGWRIDYFFVDDAFKEKVSSAFILKDIFGSDHCPIGIELSLP